MLFTSRNEFIFVTQCAFIMFLMVIPTFPDYVSYTQVDVSSHFIYSNAGQTDLWKSWGMAIWQKGISSWPTTKKHFITPSRSSWKCGMPTDLFRFCSFVKKRNFTCGAAQLIVRSQGLCSLYYFSMWSLPFLLVIASKLLVTHI